MLYEELGLKYEYYDPNPMEDNKEHSDCAVRAFTKLFKQDWNETYDELASAGKLSGNIMNHTESMKYLASSKGYDICDDLGEENTITVGEFCSKLKSANIECVLSTDFHSVYFGGDTLYDRNNPECKKGEIDYKAKLFVDNTVCSNVEMIIASIDDMEKILNVLEGKE